MRAADRARLRALVEGAPASRFQGFVGNPTAEAKKNTFFRRVLYTGPEVQLVVMSLSPGEDIGSETHRKVEQVIHIVSGQADALLDGVSYTLAAGASIIIPPGVEHNLRNAGKQPLRLFTVYSPPNHIGQTQHATKADAEADTADAAFSADINSTP